MAILRFATSHVMAQGNATINQEDKDKVVALSEKVITPSDTIWRFKGLLGLNATQSYFSNWAAGGQNTIAFTLLGAFGADYVKDRSFNV